MSETADNPIYLTSAGARRLERELAEIRAEIARLSPGPVVDSDAGDRGDAAERLIEMDDLVPLQDRLAELQDLLARARPLPDGPDDGVVRPGSTVSVRDAAGVPDQFTIVERAELDPAASGQVAADSPLGRALLGQRTGSRVMFEAPVGRRALTILAVEPYRAHP